MSVFAVPRSIARSRDRMLWTKFSTGVAYYNAALLRNLSTRSLFGPYHRGGGRRESRRKGSDRSAGRRGSARDLGRSAPCEASGVRSHLAQDVELLEGLA